MRLDLIIAIAVFTAAIFFALGYAFNIRKTADQTPQYVWVEVLFFFGSLAFLTYASLSLYEAIKYPALYNTPSEQASKVAAESPIKIL